MSEISVEEMVEAYLAIRKERDKLERDYEEQDKALKADMAEIEAMMLSVCNSMSADSIKTSHGTVMRKMNERFYCNDWDNFKSFVLEHEAVDLFERRIHQGNFKQFMADHSDDGLPPGVNVMREFTVTVRKSSNKEDMK
jgi:hypothetical protein